MREEPFWKENWLQYYDFFMFWEEKHGYWKDEDHHDDKDCDFVELETTCDSFSFIEEDCEIYSSYCRGDDESFQCWRWGTDEEGSEWKEECTEAFADREFWEKMRAEEFWYADDNWEMY